MIAPNPSPILVSETEGKIALITGGTGSFGAAVLNRFLNMRFKEIRIFSRDEKKQEDMRIELKNDRVKFYLGDVREAASLRPAMVDADIIFHAAALKQVPSCEFYPMEAIRTNVLGAENVLEAAVRFGVSKVIVLSTDKAVYPINTMGMTKALMEKLTIAKARTISGDSTVLCATRYGNVMASRGSVIPLFVAQVKAGRPITVTDPKMTRFLMSLEDSVNLVLYAAKNARQGDLFVQKAPAAKIGVLAEAVKQIFNSDAPIQVIGTRHGEKRYESLISREEISRAEDLGDYYRIPSDDRDMNYANYFSQGQKEVSDTDDYTSDNTRILDLDGVISLLRKLPFIQQQLTT